MEEKDKKALVIVHKLVELYKKDKEEFYDDTGQELINDLINTYVKICHYCSKDFDNTNFTLIHKCVFCNRPQCLTCNLEMIKKYGYTPSKTHTIVLNSRLCDKCYPEQEHEDEFVDWVRNNLD